MLCITSPQVTLMIAPALTHNCCSLRFFGRCVACPVDPTRDLEEVRCKECWTSYDFDQLSRYIHHLPAPIHLPVLHIFHNLSSPFVSPLEDPWYSLCYQYNKPSRRVISQPNQEDLDMQKEVQQSIDQENAYKTKIKELEEQLQLHRDLRSHLRLATGSNHPFIAYSLRASEKGRRASEKPAGRPRSRSPSRREKRRRSRSRPRGRDRRSRDRRDSGRH